MLAASDTAPQHAPHFAPRPLPLFLDMVRQVAAHDPDLATRALDGVRRYAAAMRQPDDGQPVQTLALGPLTARVVGDGGPPVLLVPSLINPAWIMDLDADRSLLRWLGARGFRAMLPDWGAPGPEDAGRDLAGHVTDRLLPALAAIGEPVHLVGYCLGGVLAMAAACLHPVRSLSLIATPWHFAGYGEEARRDLAALWASNSAASAQLGVLPMEVLQSAFWGLDPERSVAKFAALAGRANDDPALVAFARLEDWANGGAPLTHAAGRDLFERLIAADCTGTNGWTVGGRLVDPGALTCPARQFTASADRIAPAATAARAIAATPCPSGHVGMMVGSRAAQGCWEPLHQWIASV
jgi:polyhydroxyalkanoate synthase